MIKTIDSMNAAQLSTKSAAAEIVSVFINIVCVESRNCWKFPIKYSRISESVNKKRKRTVLRVSLNRIELDRFLLKSILAVLINHCYTKNCVFSRQGGDMKKFMKNLFACFVILVIFGAVLFFLGWTQFRVPADGFGVIVSKTGGVSKEPVLPGVFSWHWEFLIPTNAELRTFKNRNYSFTERISGELPGSETYSSLDESISDFSYRFVYKINASVKPETIITLLRSSVITDDESLSSYIETACNAVCRATSASLLKKAEKASALRPELLTSEELLELARAEQTYPDIRFSTFTLTDSVIPDFYLYDRARTVYLQNLEKRTGLKNSDIEKKRRQEDFDSDNLEAVEEPEVQTASESGGFFKKREKKG